MSVEPLGRCRRCAVRMVPFRRGLRAVDVPRGFRPHAGRGLCRACHETLDRHDALGAYPTLRRAAVQTVEEWRLLEAQGHDMASAAKKLGISRKHLRRLVTEVEGSPLRPAGPRYVRPSRAFDPCTLDEGETA